MNSPDSFHPDDFLPRTDKSLILERAYGEVAQKTAKVISDRLASTVRPVRPTQDAEGFNLATAKNSVQVIEELFSKSTVEHLEGFIATLTPDMYAFPDATCTEFAAYWSQAPIPSALMCWKSFYSVCSASTA